MHGKMYDEKVNFLTMGGISQSESRFLELTSIYLPKMAPVVPEC